MFDDFIRMEACCLMIARIVVSVLRLHALILFIFSREAWRNYRAIVAADVQGVESDGAAITGKEKKANRRAKNNQCGAAMAYWATHYISRNLQCTLCGVSGVVDTRWRAFNERYQDQGRLQFCICPAGQRWRETADSSNSKAIIETLYSYYRGDDAYKAKVVQMMRTYALQLKNAEIKGGN